MGHKIVYDRKNCEGFLVCVSTAPEDFEEADDGLADLIKGAEQDEEGLFVKEIPDDRVDEAISAAEGCPADVIKVVDDDGNVVEGPEELPIEAD